MRWALLAVIPIVLLAGVTMDSAAAPKKKGKRAADRCVKAKRCARVRHRVTRSSQDRLVSVPTGGLPAPGPGEPAPSPTPGPSLPTFVSVAAREFSLTLSRPLVAAGDVRIELRNSGEDPHNLVVSPDGTHTPLAVFSELDPGLYERRTVALSTGRYKLWCSLEFHEGYGMDVTLRVE
jgi:hypothetical protein